MTLRIWSVINGAHGGRGYHAPDHDKARLGFAFAISLALHAFLLSLHFGYAGLGLPGIALPWAERRAYNADLIARLVDAAQPLPPQAEPAPVPPAVRAIAAPPAPGPVRAPEALVAVPPPVARLTAMPPPAMAPKSPPAPEPVKAAEPLAVAPPPVAQVAEAPPPPVVPKPAQPPEPRASMPREAIPDRQKPSVEPARPQILTQADPQEETFTVPPPTVNAPKRQPKARTIAAENAAPDERATKERAEALAKAEREQERASQIRAEEEASRRAIEQEALRQRAAAVERQRQAEESAARERARELAERQNAEDAARLALALDARKKAEEQARQREDELARQREAELSRQRAAAAERQRHAEELAARERARELAERQKAEEQARQREDELAARERARELAERQKAEAAARLARALEAQRRAEELARLREDELARQREAELSRQRAAAAERQRQADELAARARELAEREQAQARAAAETERAAAAARAAEAGRESNAPASTRPITGPISGRELAAKALEQLRTPDRRADLLSPPSSAFNQRDTRRKSIIGGANVNVALRMYIESWRGKIERNGSLNYPPSAQDKNIEAPVVTVAIRSDGSLEDVFIHRSSGMREVDEAVRRIARLHAPYSAFSPELAREFDVIEIRRLWSFGDTLRIIEEM